MSLRGHLQVLRGHWKLVLSLLLLGLAIAGASIWGTTPLYAAETTLFVAARGVSGDATQAYQGALLSQQKVKSYTELVISDRVRSDVEHRGLTVDPNAISASVNPGTVLISVSVSDPSPQRAQQAADAVAESFALLVAELEKPADGGQPTIATMVVEPARLPTSPIYPRPVGSLVLGAAIGLVAGYGVALVRNALDTTVKSAKTILSLIDAPSLGSVPFDSKMADLPLIVHELPGAPRSEAMRQIRTNLQFLDVDHPAKVLVITSALPDEGKTTTACNLAIALAQTGKKVVLVDADLRQSRMGQYLGMKDGGGVTSVLIDHTALDQVLQPWGIDHMVVLASGPIPPNPSELLASPHMDDLLGELARRFDVVLVDAPPLLPVTDAAVLASRSDGALLIVRHGKTTKNQVVAAADALDAVSARLLGTVLTMTPRLGSVVPQLSYYSREPPTNLAAAPFAEVRQSPQHRTGGHL